MNRYKKHNIGELLQANKYPGRGIICGKSADDTKAVIAYFIMGRSENSRNRIFTAEGEDVTIYPFDSSKVEDPSLIIYSPLRTLGNHLIVTNGDQTDTIYDFLKEGKSVEEALTTRSFEPDAPNFTPRISATLTFSKKLSYQMSILKSIDEEGSECARYFYNYTARAGLGHFIHTYEKDGAPLPTFYGEPHRIDIPNEIDIFMDEIWNNLNEENKISLLVRFVDVVSGKMEQRILNKNI